MGYVLSRGKAELKAIPIDARGSEVHEMNGDFLSSKKIRWWFRSRSSGKLNTLTYWLLALTGACGMYLVVTVIATTGVSYYHRLGESDWLESRLPSALSATDTKSSFVDQLRPLVDRVQNSDQGQAVTTVPLYDAKLLQGNSGTCDPSGPLFADGKPDRAASMFGEGEIEVYPTCTTFSPAPNDQLSDTEKAVFRNFAVYAALAFKNHKGMPEEITHTERRLARVVGLGDAVAPASFDVPWIYIASRTGAIAVFPGTTVISDARWETKSRPWFMATFSGESQLASKGLREGDLLTVTYLDILAKTPTLVRTYLCKFSVLQPKPEEFVIGIDLHRRAFENPSGGSLLSADQAPWSRTAKGLLALALSATFFAMVFWTSATTGSNFVFRRLDGAIYGMVDVKETASSGSEDQSGSEEEVEFKAGDRLTGAFKKSHEHKVALRVDSSAEKSRSMRRGIERWAVSQDRRTSWRLFWLQFESVGRTPIGQIELTYTSAILPDAHWNYFDDQAFSDAESERHELRLPFILQRNADCCDGKHFEVADTDLETPTVLHGAGIPETVRAVVNSQELLAVRQRRAYVTLDSTRLDELYSKSDVRAVILLSYFERLLRHGQIDFLLRGRTIHRLVSFPDQAAKLDLGGTSQGTYENLINSYSPVSSRVLKRVDASIDVEGTEPQPIYDFAILNDQLLVVTHYVSETSVIDVASGKETKPRYRVDGYLSWRKSDIEFYRELFEALSKKSATMPLVIGVAE